MGKKKNEGCRKGIRRIVGGVPKKRGLQKKKTSVRCYKKVRSIVP